VPVQAGAVGTGTISSDLALIVGGFGAHSAVAAILSAGPYSVDVTEPKDSVHGRKGPVVRARIRGE
jgi:hypothetical protein